MSEVNDLLNRLGELEDAPLIWINKKVYEYQEEMQKLKNDVGYYKTSRDELITSNTKLREEKLEYQRRNEKALRYIDEVWNKTNMPTNTIVALRVLNRILNGDDKE